MRRWLIYAVLTSIVLLTQRCAPSRFVKPLAKNENALSVNLGGALIHYGKAVTPLPLTSLMYGRGLCKSTTAFGSVHLTSALFGNFQTDLGLCQRLYKNDSLRFGITLNPAINMVYDKWEKNFRAWPQLDINVYKDMMHQKGFVYLGLTNWFELTSTRAHGEPQHTHLLVNPHVGFTYNPKKWSYSIECKFLAMNRKNVPNVVDYVGIKQHGAVGLYLNVMRKF